MRVSPKSKASASTDSKKVAPEAKAKVSTQAKANAGAKVSLAQRLFDSPETVFNTDAENYVSPGDVFCGLSP